MADDTDNTTTISTGTAIDDAGLPLVMPASVARTSATGLPTKELIDWEELTRNWYVGAANKLQNSLFDITSQTNDNFAEVKRTITAVTDDQHALASDVEDLTATVGDNKATAHTELMAYVGPDGSVTQQLTQLDADFNSNSASITQEIQARSDADSAMAEEIQTLTASVGSNSASISSEAQARADADSALSARQDTFETTLNGQTATISELTGSVDGIAVQKVLKATLNNQTGGYEFDGVQNADGSGATFSMSFTANNFLLTDPNYNSGAPQNVFNYGSGIFTFNVPVVFGAGNLDTQAASIRQQRIVDVRQYLVGASTGGNFTPYQLLPYSDFQFTIDKTATVKISCNPVFYLEGGSTAVTYLRLVAFINGAYKSLMLQCQSNQAANIGGANPTLGIDQQGTLIFETTIVPPSPPNTYSIDLRWSVLATAPAAKFQMLELTEFNLSVQYR